MSMYAKMLVERALRAALSAFVGSVAIAAANPSVSVSTLKAAFIAGVAAAVSAGLTVLSGLIGNPVSGSFLPSAPPVEPQKPVTGQILTAEPLDPRAGS